MKLLLKTPEEALKSHPKSEIIDQDEINAFKTNLNKLLEKISIIESQDKDESEEHLKNDLSNFLRDTYLKDRFEINTKDKKDLVIHLGNNTNTPVGVIIEAKRPANKGEMITAENPNKKALRELILYYLNEKFGEKNNELKHLIISNINQLFIFDVNHFDSFILEHPKISKLYKTKVNDKKVNPLFYSDLESILSTIDKEIPCIHFDINDYEKSLEIKDSNNDPKLIALYHILSPEYLLKRPYVNDSNSLNKSFYGELLHIIGLKEYKKGSKKLIDRNIEDERNLGSLLENAIIQIDSLDKISRLNDPNFFGKTQEKRLFNLGLELCLTWVNRILFLKLLEAQLFAYHKGDESFKFLNLNKIKNFDDLNTLFFQVLAQKPENRNEDVKKVFDNIPYLNSSLFEPTENEHNALFISNLRDEKLIPIYSSTVLKTSHRKKKTGKLSTLEYLFEFLNSYNFGSEGTNTIQKDKKALINASVLGLIFEKINGYKDGSFFTPGFITEYMSRETIRRSVVQKFKEQENDQIDSFEELNNYCSRKLKTDDIKRFNTIINSLLVCDPAVGSGHFLVSALNELIFIKKELGILIDAKGMPLHCGVKIENDELRIKDEYGEHFNYNPNIQNSQLIQKTLFHEKQTIIENCLFGVDINPNSVKICRLRLWIELLKNAYYKEDGQLQTLPNIDINIKCGNSLISRFDLKDDLKSAFKGKDVKYNFEEYKKAVEDYKNTNSKEQKREVLEIINEVKNNFKSTLTKSILNNFNKAQAKVVLEQERQNNLIVFGEKITTADKKVLKDLKDKAERELAKKEEIVNNAIYHNAFEWRFEFPEVLDEKGDFIGFDVVIGNPPYIRVQDLQHNFIDYYKSNFIVAHKRIDISILFLELGYNLLSMQGFLSFITSNQFLKAEYGRNIRTFLKGHLKVNVDYSKVSVFDGLATYVSTFLITKKQNESVDYILMDKADDNPHDFLSFSTSSLSDEPWDFNTNQFLKTKIFRNKKSLNNIADFTYGVITGFDKAFLVPIEIIDNENLELEITKNFIRPQNYNKYQILNQTFGLIYPYKSDNTIIAESELKSKFPNCYKFLCQYKSELESRKDSRKTIKDKGLVWYSIMRRVDLSEIYAEKIIFYDVGMRPNFMFDNENHIFGGGTSHSLRIIDDEYNSKYVLGVLNSKLIEWVIYDICPVKMGNARKYGLNYIKKLPVQIAESKVRSEIENLVDKVIEAKISKIDSSKFENRIDQMVYKLYELTYEEVLIVEPKFAERMSKEAYEGLKVE